MGSSGVLKRLLFATKKRQNSNLRRLYGSAGGHQVLAVYSARLQSLHICGKSARESVLKKARRMAIIRSPFQTS